MNGRVNSNLEAVLRVRLIGRSGAAIDVDCVVDTGFTGALTLRGRLISELGFEWLSIQDTELADGWIVPTDVYAGEMFWNGARIPVEVDEAETDPLLGMELLKGFELYIQVREGGELSISQMD